MKLGTRDNGTRDGELIVFSKDFSRFISAKHLAPNLQYALDHWSQIQPLLEELSYSLHSDLVDSSAYDVNSNELLAPLPRAYEWIDGSAYIRHIELVRKARGAELPATLKTDPLVYQGGSGTLLGPTSPINIVNYDWGYDFESELCVVLSDTPQGTRPSNALNHILLLGLVNDISLRGLIPAELKKGFGFLQSKPSTVFGPAFVTPDELGSSWIDGRVHLSMETQLNGETFGNVATGPEMNFSFTDLIAHITKTRSLTAGTIIGSGTISNADSSKGSSCLAEKRMIEIIESGLASTEFLRPGDEVKIEVKANDGSSVFGAIHQKVFDVSSISF